MVKDPIGLNANDIKVEPFQPRPTKRKWTQADEMANRYGTVIRSGLYLKDKQLDGQKIEIIADAIQEEIDARTAGDEALDARVTTLENNQVDADAWKKPLADEIAARTLADTKLTQDLAKEVTDRMGADNKLSQDLTDEKNARIQKDSELEQQLVALGSFGTASRRDVGVDPTNLVEVLQNGKIDASVIPVMAITETYVVNSEAEMLALNADVGDIAVRKDLNQTFILQKLPSTEVDNWVEIVSSFDGVRSFNGQTGDVTYTAPVTSVNGKTGDTTFTVNHQAYGPDGNAQIDATQIGMGSGNPKTVAEAIADASGSSSVTRASFTAVAQSGDDFVITYDTNKTVSVPKANTSIYYINEDKHILILSAVSDYNLSGQLSIGNDNTLLGNISNSKLTFLDGQTKGTAVSISVIGDHCYINVLSKEEGDGTNRFNARINWTAWTSKPINVGAYLDSADIVSSDANNQVKVGTDGKLLVAPNVFTNTNWADLPIDTAEWVNQTGIWTCKYRILNDVLYIQGRIHSIQNVPTNTNALTICTIPNITLAGSMTMTAYTTTGIRVHCDMNASGRIQYMNTWDGKTKVDLNAGDLIQFEHSVALNNA